MRFSGRTPIDMHQNDYSKAVETVSKSKLINLIESNPTKCGFEYPKGLFESLGNAQNIHYDPDPKGYPTARKAISDYLSNQGEAIDPENIFLTSSTSESYSYLFKLLADPGEKVHIPTPGYPILEYLTRFEGLEALPYHLQMEEEWPLDIVGLRDSVVKDSRALIVIQPHNPTGFVLSEVDRQEVSDLCAEKSMALISDEVFRDYRLQPFPKWVIDERILTFRLGGLSKALGLPQLKLSWIIMDGPDDVLVEARERLELIADTYLSVNTPVQLGLQKLLSHASHIQEQIRKRIISNRNLIESVFPPENKKVKLWSSQGGWYAVLEVVSDPRKEQEIVLDLLKRGNVAVHPGDFYDFQREAIIVVGLILQEDRFAEGIRRLSDYLIK